MIYFEKAYSSNNNRNSHEQRESYKVTKECMRTICDFFCCCFKKSVRVCVTEIYSCASEIIYLGVCIYCSTWHTGRGNKLHCTAFPPLMLGLWWFTWPWRSARGLRSHKAPVHTVHCPCSAPLSQTLSVDSSLEKTPQGCGAGCYPSKKFPMKAGLPNTSFSIWHTAQEPESCWGPIHYAFWLISKLLNFSRFTKRITWFWLYRLIICLSFLLHQSFFLTP